MNSFVPHLWVVTEYTIGQPVFAVAICGGEHEFKLLPLPRDITRLPPNLELQFIGLIARSHYRQNNGEVRCFGKILRYLYLRSVNERWTFSAHGHLVNRHGDTVQKGQYSLSLKRQLHRDISFLFRRPRRNEQNPNGDSKIED